MIRSGRNPACVEDEALHVGGRASSPQLGSNSTLLLSSCPVWVVFKARFLPSGFNFLFLLTQRLQFMQICANQLSFGEAVSSFRDAVEMGGSHT